MCYLPLRLLGWNITSLECARRRLGENDTRLQPATQQLRQEADVAMKAGPYSVTFKKLAPPTGDVHEYLSFRGQDAVAGDRRSLQALSTAVQTLSLGRFFLREAKYAAHAAALLHTWFLDASTRMNPSLAHAHTLAGEVGGGEDGIKEAACLIPLLDCSLLLLGSHRWTLREHEALCRWFAALLEWLQQHEFGQLAAVRTDSLGTWYDAQIAAYSVICGSEGFARSAVQRAASRLDSQFTRDGEPRIEDCISYACYNLHGLFAIARVGEAIEEELWRLETARGRSLLKAMQHLAPYADFGKPWRQEAPDSPMQLSRRDKLASLLAQAARAWPGEGFGNWFRRLPRDLTLSHRCRLLWAGSYQETGDSSDSSLLGHTVA